MAQVPSFEPPSLRQDNLPGRLTFREGIDFGCQSLLNSLPLFEQLRKRWRLDRMRLIPH